MVTRVVAVKNVPLTSMGQMIPHASYVTMHVMAALDQALTSVLNVQRGTYVQYSVATYASICIKIFHLPPVCNFTSLAFTLCVYFC